MKSALSFALAVVIALGAFQGPSRAEDVLFTIRLTGSDATFPVTQDLLRKVGMHGYKAILPGGDGVPQMVRGPLMRDLLAASGFSGTKVWAKALDGYQMDVPMDELQHVDVLAVTEVDGERLTVRDRGPAWLVYPTVDRPDLRDPIHEARSVWQIKELLVE